LRFEGRRCQPPPRRFQPHTFSATNSASHRCHPSPFPASTYCCHHRERERERDRENQGACHRRECWKCSSWLEQACIFRWVTSVSSKVNLHHAINFRVNLHHALNFRFISQLASRNYFCGVNLFTLRSKFRPKETRVLHRAAMLQDNYLCTGCGTQSIGRRGVWLG